MLILVTAIAAIAILAVVLFSAYTFSSGSRMSAQSLPPACSKPAGGYLVIASVEGFNDSVLHGAPPKSWPVVTVQKGDTINVTVCNIDTQAHGFQINHYFDSNIESVLPGQAIHISFVADKTGTFMIYCSIFCTIHISMQDAELVVHG